MRLCFAQLNPVIGAIKENRDRIIEALEKAKAEEADLVLFPELAICGYPPEDLLLAPGFVDSCQQALQNIAVHSTGIAVIIGLPRHAEGQQDKPLYNSAAVLSDGKILGYQDKSLLPTYDVFDERRFFRPGTEQQVWDIKGKKVGITVCEDIWPFLQGRQVYPFDPLDFFERNHVEILINISASPYSLGKMRRRRELVSQIAKKFNCHFALCNQVGGQDSILFDGSSLLFSPLGELLYHGQSFTEDRVTVDLATLESCSTVSEGDAAEIFFALVMGLRDYFTKQGFKKAFVGLSGGVDSSLTASIASVALGKENIVGVLLPSRFTSPSSTEDALTVANNLGITTMEIPIDTIFENYLELLGPIFDGSGPFGETEENIQARIRSTILMALCNKENYLLLNTGNKSEIAMGYTTLYGDSAGAIAVIGDLLKRQVYEVANWIHKSFGWIPPRVIQKEPTAELRPNQKDSDSIPEYAILDPILEDFIVNNLSIEQIAQKLGHSQDFILKIAQRVHRAEFKRRQCPLSLRISEKAFAVGRRVPIVERSL